MAVRRVECLHDFTNRPCYRGAVFKVLKKARKPRHLCAHHFEMYMKHQLPEGGGVLVYYEGEREKAD